jgi:hypothetical protein
MTAAADSTNVIRALRDIERDIKEHVDAGDHAAAEAAEPHYRRAGPLLVEAKEGHFVGDTAGFYNWAQKKFGKSQTQIRAWLHYAGAVEDKSFKSLGKVRYSPKSEGGMGQSPPRSRPWTQPVDEIAERARREAFRVAQEEALSRAEEREAEHKLGHRLIDIGYRVLAKELHPDKMRGDKRAFQRLGRVRDKLKHSI